MIVRAFLHSIVPLCASLFVEGASEGAEAGMVGGGAVGRGTF